LKDKDFESWSNNRVRSRLKKFHSWRARPLGAIIRTLEIATLGAPLQQIVRSNNDIDEIKHLTPDVWISGSMQDLHTSKARASMTSGLVLLASGHIIARHLNSHSYLSGNLNDEIRILMRKKPFNFLDEIFVVLPKQEYFYHFLIDFLPHVIRLQEENPRLIVLINQDEEKYVIEYFRLHNIRSIETNARTISVHHLVVPNFASLDLKSIRSLLCGSLDNYDHLPVTPKKIAMLRFRGSRHDSEFEIKLKDYLVNQGYEVFDPDFLQISEQIRIFSGATEVVSIHGGVLANLIYCKEGTKVHEIFTHPYRTLFFMAISRDLGLNYTSCESVDFDFHSQI
jgi:capsular polysaccharide biosynthesis protein